FVNQPNSKILRNGHDSPSKKGIESQTPIQSKIKKQNVDSEDPGNALGRMKVDEFVLHAQ
ncbi:MAG: hypothetical protein QF384_08845, partial [Alphaproteobacteria bacterium]|nr:hypothetical protein [Alphaproteobacteria bacterium]